MKSSIQFTEFSPVESSFSHGLREPQDPRHHNVHINHLKKEHVDSSVKKLMEVIPDLRGNEELLRSFLSEGRALTSDHNIANAAKRVSLDKNIIINLFTPTKEELTMAGFTPLDLDFSGPLTSDIYNLKCIEAVGVAVFQVITLAMTSVGVFVRITPAGANAIAGVLGRLPANIFARIQQLLIDIKNAADKSIYLIPLLGILWETKVLAVAFNEWASNLPWWRILFDLAVAIANVSLWFLTDGAYILVAIGCVLVGIVQLIILINDAINICKGNDETILLKSP